MNCLMARASMSSSTRESKCLPQTLPFFQRKASFVKDVTHLSLNLCSQELYNAQMVNGRTIFFISFVPVLPSHFEVDTLLFQVVSF